MSLSPHPGPGPECSGLEGPRPTAQKSFLCPRVCAYCSANAGTFLRGCFKDCKIVFHSRTNPGPTLSGFLLTPIPCCTECSFWLMEVAVITRQRKLWPLFKAPITPGEKKIEKMPLSLSIPRTHRSASHAAIITSAPRQRAREPNTWGQDRRTDTGGQASPASPAVHPRASVSTSLGTCGAPGRSSKALSSVFSHLPPQLQPSQLRARVEGGNQRA